MPPRTTRKSDRRKASDRTMVGIAQPLCLFASGTEARRYDSTMNLRKKETHRVSSHYWGWTARPFPLGLTVVGEAFVLTSPFIERRYRKVALRSHCRSAVRRPLTDEEKTVLPEAQANTSAGGPRSRITPKQPSQMLVFQHDCLIVFADTSTSDRAHIYFASMPTKCRW
jgi:hypothetical protein